MDINLWLWFFTSLTCSDIIYQIWILTYQLVNEFRQDIYKILIFGFLFIELLEKGLIFIPDFIQLVLGILLLSFVIKNSFLQELCQIRFAEISWSRSGTVYLISRFRWSRLIHIGISSFSVFNFFFEKCYLSFILLDNLITEVWSLGKFIFNFSMLVKLTFQHLHLFLQLIILVCQLLNMLWLIFQLTWKLEVLIDSQFGSALKLILIHIKHLHLHIPDIHKHFFSKFINGCSSFLLDDT